MTNLLPFERIQRTVIEVRKVKTSAKFSVYGEVFPVEQLINYGIINIDKPRGPTSHQVSDYVKKILGISKAGHSGTLDPNVTGVLPVALGRGTRVVQTLLTAGKENVSLMQIYKEL